MPTQITILIIDDDRDFRDGLSTLLSSTGFQVCEASNGAVGLELVTKIRPDLIVVDMLMPKVSGFVVLERVKHHMRIATPVVMVTGNAADDQENYAKILGVDAFLQKPISGSKIIETIHFLTSSRRNPTENLSA